MGKPKVNEDQKEEIKILFVKGMLACEEIGERYGLSRQGVANILKGMGVDTAKKKIVLPCTQCQTPVEKTRAEFRKHDNHFCSKKCYDDYLRRPDVQDEIQRQRVMRDKCAAFLPVVDGMFAAFFQAEDDIFVFPSREALLEWQRTKLPALVISICKGKKIRVTP